MRDSKLLSAAAVGILLSSNCLAAGPIIWDQYTPIDQKAAKETVRKAASEKKDVGCNAIILNKRMDADKLLRCDIAYSTNVIMRDGNKYIGQHSFHAGVVKNRTEILDALNSGAIGAREAMSLREASLKRDILYLEEQSRSLSMLEAAAYSPPIYQTALFPSREETYQPKSVTCGKRDIFGNVKCDFQ